MYRGNSRPLDQLDLVGTGRYLSKDELRTWTRFLDAGWLLEEILAGQLSQDHDMTHSDYEVLVRLDGNGGHMWMAVLAQQVGVPLRGPSSNGTRNRVKGCDKDRCRILTRRVVPAGGQLRVARDYRSLGARQFAGTRLV